MRGMYYFDHDNNAHNDTKIIRVKRKFGYEGYGVYWLLLEVLHANTGFVTSDILDDVAYQERIDDEWLEKFIDFCVSIDLFKRDGDLLYSERMLTDIQAFKQLGEKRRAAALSRYNKRTGDDQPDNRNIPQNNNTDAEIAARAMEALNRKFDEAMAAAEQTETPCDTETEQMQPQEDNSCNATADNLQIQNNSNDNANVVQTDNQELCNSNANAMQENKQMQSKCNANAEQVQTICTAKKRKENKIKKTTTNKNYQDTITLTNSDIPDDIIFPDPEDSIMINDFDDIPDFNPEQDEEPSTDELSTLLSSYGISASKSIELQCGYDKNYIYSKIDLLRQQDGIQNAAAWLIQAIEHDWRPPVKQSAPPPIYTAANNDNALGGKDYDDFRAIYRRVFGSDFTDKAAYMQAVKIFGTPSHVARIIKHAEEIGADAFRRFVAENSVKNFGDLITHQDLVNKLAELHTAAAAQYTAEMMARFNARCEEIKSHAGGGNE